MVTLITPVKIYRLKQRGMQKIFWKDSVGAVHGKDFSTYTMNYNRELAESLVRTAHEGEVTPRFYFFVPRSRHTSGVNPEDYDLTEVTETQFLGDFDNQCEILRSLTKSKHLLDVLKPRSE